jgi:acyl dehydratase
MLATLEKGYKFEPTRLELTEGWVREYISAVEDGAIGSIARDAVPPMALAALSIRSLIDRSSLPEGSIHVGQELAFHRIVPLGETLSAQAEITSRGERQGWVLMAVAMTVVDERGEPVMNGRATITFPLETGASE